MPISVKPVAEVAAKWGEVTPGRSSYYQKGVTGAGTQWERNTAAAAAAYKAAVSAANIEKMFAGGVKKAGGAKYERKATDVGVSRFGPGVSAAVPDYLAGVAPMLEAIAGVTLTPRAPRGSDINYNRVKEVGTALAKKRLALRAAG